MSTTCGSLCVHAKEHPENSTPWLHLKGVYFENAALKALPDA